MSLERSGSSLVRVNIYNRNNKYIYTIIYTMDIANIYTIIYTIDIAHIYIYHIYLLDCENILRYEKEKGLRAVYKHIKFYGIRGFFRSFGVAFFEEDEANSK